ncbi:MAG: hypothetical protein AB7S97_03325 [Thermoplasmata archaeon]
MDVSACKQKKDLVARLAAASITEAQVAEALRADASASGKEAGVEEIKRDIEEIAAKSDKGRVLPSNEDEEVERNIDRVLLSRPSFFEIDSRVESAWNHMIMANYLEAMKTNSEARSRMLDRFSSFQIFSCALSIRAAESIITSLGEAKGKVDPRIKTALAEAKRAFVDGNPKHREQTLEELENLTSKAYEAFFEGSTVAEGELRAMLLDYESFGAQTQEPRRLLEIAEQARQSFNVTEYARLLEDARRGAARAKEARTSEIEEHFGIVRSAVDEALELGAVLAVGDKELTEAKQAFDEQAFKKSVELLASVESVADRAHLEKIKDMDVRQRHSARVSEDIAGLEKTLQEAASYGMDVQDGLLFVSRARRAFSERDLVTAAKLTRHLKDKSAPMTKELDRERIKRGVAKKVADGKCGKCGKEALYAFPGDVRKCVKCGHTFSMTAEPRPVTMEPLEKPVSASPGTEPRTDTPDTKLLRVRKLLSR